MDFRSKVLPVVILVAALVLPTQATTQVSLGGGPSFPMGSLADEARTGHHYQGSVTVSPAVLPFRLRTDLFYQRFNGVEREPNINVSLGGEWYRQLGFKLNAMYEFPLQAASPYVLLGGAWLREWHGDRTFSGTNHTAFSLNAGVGVHIPVTDGVELFLEAPYLNFAAGKALPTNPPAVLEEVQFRSIPTTIGVRLGMGR